MSPRTDTTSTAGAGGVFQRLGDFVVRWPWLVIGCWVALAVVLSALFPSLTEMTHKHPVPLLPASAPSTLATGQMTAAFHEAGSGNVLLVLLSNDKGLGRADEQRYRTLVDRLHQDSQDVVMLQEFVAHRSCARRSVVRMAKPGSCRSASRASWARRSPMPCTHGSSTSLNTPLRDLR